MKKLFLAIIAIVTWAVCVSAQTFVVYTANLQHGEGTDLVTSYSRQITALSDGDLIAVQERTTGDTGWNAPMNTAGFTEAVYRENAPSPSQGDGPAIWYRYSKFTLLDTKQTDLSSGFVGLDGFTDVDKAAVAAKFAYNGKVFWFVSTHLCWSQCADSAGSQFSAKRVSQATTLINWIAANLTGDVIIAGDMNFGPDYPKAGGGFQRDLFTADYDDLWVAGIAGGVATTPWGDRDANGTVDMTPADLGTQSTGTRTHDTRRIDYFFLSKMAAVVSLVSISVPDMRATCPTALTSNGTFKECSAVDSSQQSDVADDQGVRPSDHNFMRAVFVSDGNPTASINCPATAFVGEPVVCDGSASTGVSGQLGWSTNRLADGTSPVDINFGDNRGPYSHAEQLKATHAYLEPGTYTVGITVKDWAGEPASTSTSITISAIPAATGGNIQTLTDTGNNTTNCANFQTALNTAFSNNTVPQEIRLPVATWACQPTIQNAAGTSWVTVRPIDISWLPGPVTRVTPALAANMPKLRGPLSTDGPIPNGVPFLMTGTGKRYLRFRGIEFNKPAGLLMNSLLMIGTDGSVSPTAYNQVPDHVMFEHCYFKGNAADDTTRAILVYANDFSVINSYFTDFHDGGADSQTVAVMDGKRQAMVNNHAEAYGENVLYGGSETRIRFSATVTSGTPTSAVLSAPPTNLNVGDGISFMVAGNRGPWSASIVRSISGSTITFDPITNVAGVPTAPDTTFNVVKYGSSPQDIFIAWNYLYKSLTFRVGDPSYGGVFAVVKNSFELKHAMRVTAIGNFIENMWGGQGQDGHTVLFTPRNQTCYLVTLPRDPVTCPTQDNPWVMVRDVQFAYTRVKNIPDFLNVLGTDNLNPPGEGNDSGPSALAQNISVTQVLIEGTDPAASGAGQLALLWPGTKNIALIHNTQTNVAGGAWILSSEAPIGHLIPNALVLNNIAPHQYYGVFGDGRFIQDFMPFFMPDGFIHHNVLSDDFSSIVPNGEVWSAPQAGPNAFPATINTNTFINLAGGNFRLKPDSPYKNTATDGADPGVNFDDVLAATLNTVTGDWGAVVGPTIRGGMRGKGVLKGKAVIR